MTYDLFLDRLRIVQKTMYRLLAMVLLKCILENYTICDRGQMIW